MGWTRHTLDEDEEVVVEDAVLDEAPESVGVVVWREEVEFESCVGSVYVEAEVARLFVSTPKPPSVPNRTAKMPTMATAPMMPRTFTDFLLYQGSPAALVP